MIRHGIKYMYNEGSIKADYGTALAQHFNEQTHIRTRQYKGHACTHPLHGHCFLIFSFCILNITWRLSLL